jgi:rhamnosyltransferase
VSYLACLAAFALLARRARSPGDALVRVVLQFILGFWLLLPMLLIDSVESIADRLPVDVDFVRDGYFLEAGLLLVVVCAYLAITERWGRAPEPIDEVIGTPAAAGAGALAVRWEPVPDRDGWIALVSAGVVLVSIVASILSPSTYEEINAIGSEAGVGGKFGLPLVEPLFAAYLFAYFVFHSRRSPRIAWACFALVTAKAVAGAAEGARIVVLLPLLMLYFRRVMESGRLAATRWLGLVSLGLFPAGAYLLVAMAEVRVGSEFTMESFASMADTIEIVATHFFIKSSSVVSAAALLDMAPVVAAGEAATAMTGALVFFVPRFLWMTKPISGSIDGAETGLPYRIAADLLGYPDYGNVGLSPFLTSLWLAGIVGISLTAAILIANTVLVRRFLDAKGSERTVLAGVALYAIGVPHMTGLWIDFSAGTSVLLRLVFLGALVHLVMGKVVAGQESGRPGEGEGPKEAGSIRPSVAVLLATHDGVQFLPEQVDSIFGQRGVDVTVFVSDDHSSDGTWELLEEWAGREARLRLLPRERRFGSAAPNFYHLLLSVEPSGYDAVAFADQDDVWYPWKLRHHLDLLTRHAVGGVSSSVLAFWSDGREHIIEKAGRMRKLDHHFQSPGPGCTFLVTRPLAEMLRSCLSREDTGAHTFVFHDWLVYAVARSCGFGWHISDRPSLRYRQHGSNEWGANTGPRAFLRRLRRLVDGTYSGWVENLLHITRSATALTGSPPPPTRVSAIRIAIDGRRRLGDRLLVAATHPLGVAARAPSAPEGAK